MGATRLWTAAVIALKQSSAGSTCQKIGSLDCCTVLTPDGRTRRPVGSTLGLPFLRNASISAEQPQQRAKMARSTERSQCRSAYEPHHGNRIRSSGLHLIEQDRWLIKCVSWKFPRYPMENYSRASRNAQCLLSTQSGHSEFRNRVSNGPFCPHPLREV